MIRSDYSFPKSNRILKKQEFDLFFDGAKHLTLGNIKVFYKHTVLQRKIAFSISSRFFNSCKRNRLKRIIREWFRYNKQAFLTLELVVSVRYSSDINDDFNLFQDKLIVNLENISRKLV